MLTSSRVAILGPVANVHWAMAIGNKGTGTYLFPLLLIHKHIFNQIFDPGYTILMQLVEFTGLPTTTAWLNL